MEIAALPGMLPEGLHHLLIGRFLRVAHQPFRQRNAKGRWQGRILFQQPLKHPLLIGLIQFAEAAFHPVVQLNGRHVPQGFPQRTEKFVCQ